MQRRRSQFPAVQASKVDRSATDPQRSVLKESGVLEAPTISPKSLISPGKLPEGRSCRGW